MRRVNRQKYINSKYMNKEKKKLKIVLKESVKVEG